MSPFLPTTLRRLAAAALLLGCATAAPAQEKAAAPEPAPQDQAAPEQAGLNQAQAHGKQVFDAWCAACHAGGDGGNDFLTGQVIPRLPGTNALHAKYQDEVPALLEERTDLVPETVEYFVRNGVSVMPAFRKTEIGDEDLAALGAYLARNATE